MRFRTLRGSHRAIRCRAVYETVALGPLRVLPPDRPAERAVAAAPGRARVELPIVRQLQPAQAVCRVLHPPPIQRPLVAGPTPGKNSLGTVAVTLAVVPAQRLRRRDAPRLPQDGHHRRASRLARPPPAPSASAARPATRPAARAASRLGRSPALPEAHGGGVARVDSARGRPRGAGRSRAGNCGSGGHAGARRRADLCPRAAAR